MIKLLTITGETIEWSEGNHGAIDIKVRRGCSVTVKCDRCRDVVLTAQPDYDTWCRATFNFCKEGIVFPYKIEVFSDRADSILEIIDVLWDTSVTVVTVHDCPSLISMRFHNVSSFEFLGCPYIEDLDCDYYKGKILDLRALPELKSLQCRSGEAATIDLSKSPKLNSLILCGCKMKTLKVSNHTRLENLCIDDCDNLRPPTRLWLEEKLRGHLMSNYKCINQRNN